MSEAEEIKDDDIECDECDGKGVKPAARWSDDGTGEDCWKCKGEGKLHGQHDDEEA